MDRHDFVVTDRTELLASAQAMSASEWALYGTARLMLASLRRGALLGCLAIGDEPLTLDEWAREANIRKPEARSALARLLRRGIVERHISESKGREYFRVCGLQRDRDRLLRSTRKRNEEPQGLTGKNCGSEKQSGERTSAVENMKPGARPEEAASASKVSIPQGLTRPAEAPNGHNRECGKRVENFSQSAGGEITTSRRPIEAPQGVTADIGCVPPRNPSNVNGREYKSAGGLLNEPVSSDRSGGGEPGDVARFAGRGPSPVPGTAAGLNGTERNGLLGPILDRFPGGAENPNVQRIIALVGNGPNANPAEVTAELQRLVILATETETERARDLEVSGEGPRPAKRATSPHEINQLVSEVEGITGDFHSRRNFYQQIETLLKHPRGFEALRDLMNQFDQRVRSPDPKDQIHKRGAWMNRALNRVTHEVYTSGPQ